MRTRWRPLCAAIVTCLAVPGTGVAQWLEYPTRGVPRTADGKPDLSGMWGWETRANCGAHCNDLQISREFIDIAATLKGGLPYKPGVAEEVKRRMAAQNEDPNARCMPRGAPRIWTDDYYKRIFHVSDRVIILTERNMQYRQIFTDGRPLPKDQNPTWHGHSTAAWQGDTLVVQTSGFKTTCGWTLPATRWRAPES